MIATREGHPRLMLEVWNFIGGAEGQRMIAVGKWHRGRSDVGADDRTVGDASRTVATSTIGSSQ